MRKTVLTLDEMIRDNGVARRAYCMKNKETAVPVS